MRIAYVNGSYIDNARASVHIEDRGYQFSDGIYEYIAFYNQRLLDGDLHFKRLERSLRELEIAMPVAPSALKVIARELIERNGREEGGLYVQVTRGVSMRNHIYPKNVRPSLVMTVCGAKTPKPAEFENGVKIMSYNDNRWGRRDIKTVSLLPNIMAKQEANRQKMREALLIEKDGTVNEGSAANFFMVVKGDVLVTHPADNDILPGVTRDVLIKLASKNGIAVDERKFDISEAKAAPEAFITSTSINVLPVVKIDDRLIGKGVVGDVTRKLQQLYSAHIYKQTGKVFE
jgi:D-alanine transaminase